MQETENLKLKLYEGTDITSYLNVGNTNLSLIDAGYGDLSDKITENGSKIEELESGSNENSSSINTINDQISSLQTSQESTTAALGALRQNVILNTQHNNDQDTEILNLKTKDNSLESSVNQNTNDIEENSTKIQNHTVQISNLAVQTDSNATKINNLMSQFKLVNFTTSSEAGTTYTFGVIDLLQNNEHHYIIGGRLPIIRGVSEIPTIQMVPQNYNLTRNDNTSPYYHVARLSATSVTTVRFQLLSNGNIEIVPDQLIAGQMSAQCFLVYL